jgi:hypothetical protein
MKELENQDKLNQKTQIESVVKKKKQVELKYEGSIQPKSKSHTLWEINTKTLEVTKAKYVSEEFMTWEQAVSLMEGTYVEKVVRNPNCIYISSLTKRTALERYKKNKGSAIIKNGIMTL